MALGLLVASYATPAHAAPQAGAHDAHADTLTDGDDPAFNYTESARPTYLRATVELVTLLGLGFVQYQFEKANEVDKKLNYDWQSFRSKLVLDAASFDDNKFATNWFTHPGAGMLYYSAARANRVGLARAFALTVAASTFWEYIGEYREPVAINDLVATPIGGLAVGEAFTQIGAVMHRSRPSFATTALGWIFAPWKSAHDAVDGMVPTPPSAFDDAGLPTDTWQRFRIGGGAGVTWQEDVPTRSDARFAASARVVTLPSYGRGGQSHKVFRSGEVSSLGFATAMSEGDLVDLSVTAHTLPIGYYWQDVRAAPGGLYGHGFLVGTHVGVEYAVHDYDRDGRRPQDQIGLVAVGATIEHAVHVGPVTVRGRLDVLGDFAGIQSYALPVIGDSAPTLAVLEHKGYYHAFGATARPVFELESGRFDTGFDLRFDTFSSIRGSAPEQGLVFYAPDVKDRRISTKAWVGIRPSRHMRLSVSVEGRERAGTLGQSWTSRRETGLYGGAELVF